MTLILIYINIIKLICATGKIFFNFRIFQTNTKCLFKATGLLFGANETEEMN